MTKLARLCLTPALTLAAVLALSACTGQPEKPNLGEQISAEGGEVALLGSQWTKGDAMIAEGKEMAEDGRDAVDSGKKMVSKGEDRISDGRNDISRGDRMVAKGEQMKRAAELKYQQRTGKVLTQG